MEIASHPNPDFPKQRERDGLWLLVGSEDYCDKSTAHYLGPDRDGSGKKDLALPKLEHICEERGIDIEEAKVALLSYRVYLK